MIHRIRSGRSLAGAALLVALGTPFAAAQVKEDWRQPTFANRLALDSENNIFVDGFGPGSNFIADKHSPDGTLQWSTTFGAPTISEHVNWLAVDSQGAVILTGFPEQEGAEEIDRALAVRGVIGVHLLEGTEIGQQQTAERAAREARGEADQSFAAVLFVEGIDEEPVRRATEAAAARLGAKSAAVYRIQHVLTSEEVA